MAAYWAASWKRPQTPAWLADGAENEEQQKQRHCGTGKAPSQHIAHAVDFHALSRFSLRHLYLRFFFLCHE